MREYDDATLKRVQDTEMEILKDFIKVCDENNLTWFGDAGTAIGAIRHKGFIPWDDDIDVMLPRKDFDKMIEVFERDYADKYTIGNVDHIDNYPLMTTRLMLNGTTFIEEPLKNINCHLGIFLDIYPLDNIPDDENLRNKQAKRAWFWSKLMILRFVAFPVLPVKGFMAKLIHLVTAIIHWVLVIFHISPKWMAKKCKQIATMYNDQETERIGFLFDTVATQHTFKKSELYPLEMYEYEDIMMPLPACIDQNLKILFGDYMQLPPVEKRKNHFPYKLEFRDDK